LWRSQPWLVLCAQAVAPAAIQSAVDAAHNGDTIVIGPGTYRGGVSILKSVRIKGSGASSTIIRGGTHMLTIGALGATREPVVSISGVTIIDGVARSSPLSGLPEVSS
jgi:hypothetical protein